MVYIAIVLLVLSGINFLYVFVKYVLFKFLLVIINLIKKIIDKRKK